MSEERFAERTIVGRDDHGEEERIVIWLSYGEGGLWIVGRAVNPHLRDTLHARPEDLVYESYELDDALAHVNEMLEDEAQVLDEDGGTQTIRPITRIEVEPLLERRVFRAS